MLMVIVQSLISFAGTPKSNIISYTFSLTTAWYTTLRFIVKKTELTVVSQFSSYFVYKILKILNYCLSIKSHKMWKQMFQLLTRTSVGPSGNIRSVVGCPFDRFAPLSFNLNLIKHSWAVAPLHWLISAPTCHWRNAVFIVNLPKPIPRVISLVI